MLLFSEYRRDFQETVGADWYGRSKLMNSPQKFFAPFWFEMAHYEISALFASFNLYRAPDFSSINYIDNEIISTIEMAHKGELKPNLAGSYLRDHQVGVSGFKIHDCVFLPNSSGLDIYGHWLLDVLPSLIYASSIFGFKFPVYIDKRLPHWARDLVSSFGFNVCDELVGQKFFLLSGMPRIHDYLNVDIYNRYKHYVRTHFQTDSSQLKLSGERSGYRRIYLSRSKLTSCHRQMRNSVDVMNFFEDAGFKVVFPEHIGILEQQDFFKDVEVLAGEPGSALHNSVYCKEHITVIALQSARQSHFIQSSLCSHFDQKSIIILGDANTDDWNSSFRVEMKACENVVNSLSS